MSTLLQADIFFFITSVCVVLLSVGVGVALYYVIHILRDIQAIVAQARKAGEEIEGVFSRIKRRFKRAPSSEE